MFILTSLDSLNLDIDDLPATKEELTDEHYRLIFDSIKSAYEDNANDDEATLYELIYEDTFIFGAFEPEKLIERVTAWNADIRANFIRALQPVAPFIDGPDQDKLPMDDDTTHAIACAARELDNVWYDYAAHGVYLENDMGWPYFTTLVDKYSEECIKACPANYLIFEVTPK